MPTARMTLRVHYPLGSGALLLRTDADWERDVEPVEADEAEGRFEFTVDFPAPYRYFKPVLRRDGELYWSQGANYLALQNGRTELDVFPSFFSPLACTACTLHEVEATGPGRRHAVRVFQPPGYDENVLERFPVLYMQDGQNLFFPEEAFGGQDWMIDDTLDVLTAMNLIRRAIVVGVYPRDRLEDYTRPGYESYGRYVIDHVRPWVDQRFRTLTGPRHTAVMGSSLGGVVSMYLAWQWPEVFGFAGCLSSTFGYRDDLAERVTGEAKRPIRIYLDSGWPGDNYEVTRNMRNLLIERGYRQGRDLMYLAFPRARHDERAWSMRAHIPFQHFFGV